jgi:hypothetical protein
MKKALIAIGLVAAAIAMGPAQIMAMYASGRNLAQV